MAQESAEHREWREDKELREARFRAVRQVAEQLAIEHPDLAVDACVQRARDLQKALTLIEPLAPREPEYSDEPATPDAPTEPSTPAALSPIQVIPPGRTGHQGPSRGFWPQGAAR